MTKHKIYSHKRLRKFINVASRLHLNNLEQIEYVRECYHGYGTAKALTVIARDGLMVNRLLFFICPKLKRLQLTHCCRYKAPLPLSRSLSWFMIDQFYNHGQLNTLQNGIQNMLDQANKRLLKDEPSSLDLRIAATNWQSKRVLGEVTTGSPRELHSYSLVFYREASK